MLAPAAAHAEDGGFVRAMRNHAERSSQRDNVSDNSSSHSQSQHNEQSNSDRSNGDRPTRVERVQRDESEPRVERVQRVERVNGEDRGTRPIERIFRRDRDVQQVEQAQTTEPVQQSQQTQQTERRREGLAGAFSRVGRDMADGRTNDGDGRHGDHDGDRDWRRHHDGRHDWSRDWRHDRRYDWLGYRNHYRSLFRLGHYYDPYGWNYRRFSIGFNLWPSYYGSSFWLDDPWQYRLPPAYGPYRWIRYYDDALLVNIYTGEVVDVEYNVFW
jgi:Ni/Co efflux regulator RcnB